MRKPEEGIFLHAADALGLAPAECVFIDDMEANVAAATDLRHDRPAPHRGGGDGGGASRTCSASRSTGAKAGRTGPRDLAGATARTGLALVVVPDYPHPSSAGRSANMRANRRTDTKPELALRRALHRLGYRYRKDYRLDLDGGRRVRPDIAFTARKVAIFVDGCFWHACPEHGSKPRANEWYWGPKLLKQRRARPGERRRADHGGLDGGPPLGAPVARGGGRDRGNRPRRNQRRPDGPDQTAHPATASPPTR